MGPATRRGLEYLPSFAKKQNHTIELSVSDRRQIVAFANAWTLEANSVASAARRADEPIIDETMYFTQAIVESLVRLDSLMGDNNLSQEALSTVLNRATAVVAYMDFRDFKSQRGIRKPALKVSEHELRLAIASRRMDMDVVGAREVYGCVAKLATTLEMVTLSSDKRAHYYFPIGSSLTLFPEQVPLNTDALAQKPVWLECVLSALSAIHDRFSEDADTTNFRIQSTSKLPRPLQRHPLVIAVNSEAVEFFCPSEDPIPTNITPLAAATITGSAVAFIAERIALSLALARGCGMSVKCPHVVLKDASVRQITAAVAIGVAIFEMEVGGGGSVFPTVVIPRTHWDAERIYLATLAAKIEQAVMRGCKAVHLLELAVAAAAL